ncbi:MAG: four helix bundle protein [Anaerolineales bacterium]
MTPAELRDRSRAFSLRVIKMVQALPNDKVAEVLGKQALWSATSVAANYRAACRAIGTPTFLAKLSIVVEEADETEFWLELIRDAGLVKPARLAGLLNEAEQIVKIMSASRKTARQRKPITKSLNHQISK